MTISLCYWLWKHAGTWHGWQWVTAAPWIFMQVSPLAPELIAAESCIFNCLSTLWQLIAPQQFKLLWSQNNETVFEQLSHIRGWWFLFMIIFLLTLRSPVSFIITQDVNKMSFRRKKKLYMYCACATWKSSYTSYEKEVWISSWLLKYRLWRQMWKIVKYKHTGFCCCRLSCLVM